MENGSQDDPSSELFSFIVLLHGTIAGDIGAHFQHPNERDYSTLIQPVPGSQKIGR